ncbi:MAG: hypothetical protein GY703_06340 [Gammaproteobacteria bacterium]|nr:hypothetical protein [Gammaproteobacteria bacterium]
MILKFLDGNEQLALKKVNREWKAFITLYGQYRERVICFFGGVSPGISDYANEYEVLIARTAWVTQKMLQPDSSLHYKWLYKFQNGVTRLQEVNNAGEIGKKVGTSFCAACTRTRKSKNALQPTLPCRPNLLPRPRWPGDPRLEAEDLAKVDFNRMGLIRLCNKCRRIFCPSLPVWQKWLGVEKRWLSIHFARHPACAVSSSGKYGGYTANSFDDAFLTRLADYTFNQKNAVGTSAAVGKILNWNAKTLSNGRVCVTYTIVQNNRPLQSNASFSPRLFPPRTPTNKIRFEVARHIATLGCSGKWVQSQYCLEDIVRRILRVGGGVSVKCQCTVMRRIRMRVYNMWMKDVGMLEHNEKFDSAFQHRWSSHWLANPGRAVDAAIEVLGFLADEVRGGENWVPRSKFPCRAARGLLGEDRCVACLALIRGWRDDDILKLLLPVNLQPLQVNDDDDDNGSMQHTFYWRPMITLRSVQFTYPKVDPSSEEQTTQHSKKKVKTVDLDEPPFPLPPPPCSYSVSWSSTASSSSTCGDLGGMAASSTTTSSSSSAAAWTPPIIMRSPSSSRVAW